MWNWLREDAFRQRCFAHTHWVGIECWTAAAVTAADMEQRDKERKEEPSDHKKAKKRRTERKRERERERDGRLSDLVMIAWLWSSSCFFLSLGSAIFCGYLKASFECDTHRSVWFCCGFFSSGVFCCSIPSNQFHSRSNFCLLIGRRRLWVDKWINEEDRRPPPFLFLLFGFLCSSFNTHELAGVHTPFATATCPEPPKLARAKAVSPVAIATVLNYDRTIRGRRLFAVVGRTVRVILPQLVSFMIFDCQLSEMNGRRQMMSRYGKDRPICRATLAGSIRTMVERSLFYHFPSVDMQPMLTQIDNFESQDVRWSSNKKRKKIPRPR